MTVNLKPEAKAVADLDAVCDDFESAFHDGEIDLDSDESVWLAPYLARVSPELASWLREELTALRDEWLSDQQRGTAAAPVGVPRESWDAVNQCSTCQFFSPDAKLLLAKQLQPREFAEGDHILRSGEAASGLFLITAGTIRVMGSGNVGPHEIDTDGAGSIVGEMSLLTSYPCSADVVAGTPVQAYVLPADQYRSLCEASPEIEIALSQLVSDRLGHRSQDALCGKTLAGYRLRNCISRGAMGVVYAAENESDGTRCALKMLRHRFIYNPQVRSRFDQEVDLLQQLRHPNIVAIRGHFIAYRTRFIVLDLYDGSDLHGLVGRGPMAESTARGLLGQLAAGLRYAHQQGVLHLDLKPANALVDREGRVAITDFGLSRLIESDSCDRDRVGTPLYMPPEQFLMADIGPHCDWYSFGCIMFELVAGRRLFEGRDTSKFLDDKLREPSPWWPNCDASDDYLRWMRSALQPSVEHRELDLDLIAQWARPVPELAALLAPTTNSSDADNEDRG